MKGIVTCSCGYTQELTAKTKSCNSCGIKFTKTPHCCSSWTANSKIFQVRSEEDLIKTMQFLKLESEMDKINHQEMLNVVDLTEMTKAKIGALGKLGKQYEKATKALMKSYLNAKIVDFVKEKTWIRSTY